MTQYIQKIYEVHPFFGFLSTFRELQNSECRRFYHFFPLLPATTSVIRCFIEKKNFPAIANEDVRCVVIIFIFDVK